MPAMANPSPTPLQPSPLLPTRNVLNGGFEQPTRPTNGAGASVAEGYNLNPPIIWLTTEDTTPYANALEIWAGTNTNNGGPTAGAHSGNQHAELNGSSNASIYQDICMLPNETVDWSLWHAARSTGETNIMRVSITDPTLWIGKTPPTTQLYTSSNLSTSYSQGWQNKTGNWTSTVTSTKNLRFAFSAIQGSSGSTSLGNFIDDVNLNLSPIIDFLPTNPTQNVNLSTTTEGNTPNNYYLSLRINGTMQTAGTITINLTGLNSNRNFTVGSVLKGSTTSTGLSAIKSGNNISLSIPAGIYDPNLPSNYIHIPIDFSDLIAQPNDALIFTLSNPSGGGSAPLAIPNLSINSSGCLGSPQMTVNTALVDDDFDYGDAPDTGAGTGTGNYKTTASDGGPRHILDNRLKLGTNADPDSGLLQNSTATADDNNGTPNDEDAFTSLPNVPTSGTYGLSNIPVVNTLGTPATLHAWVDFNKNGSFEATEYTSAVVPNNATTANLSWAVPSGTTAGTTFARFRLTTQTLTDNTGTAAEDERSLGLASDGEVEDDRVSVVNPADVFLLKRITAINGLTTNPNDNTTSLTGVLVDPKWKAGYVVGATNGGPVKPGDRIEYTIYYLNNGGRNAKSVLICDRLNANQSFQQNTYTTGAGMQVQIGGDRITNTAVNLTNQSGDDGGQFIAATNTALPTNCNLTGINNNYGALILDLAGTTIAPVVPTLTNLPNATGQGTPLNSFGFWRFTTKVNISP